ncbi:electron transport complex subunit RsxG [Tolumonas lignilytica]|jgi:electron transport complex, RnfABCDGE type, G subunit|uniref:electron transport complex subunit RsxG n=1 Tax=Tolumonas lignilytica TaxID=1283284 RepID=UPI000466DEB0|nr:electron transport complex subunit RsxG [Tolumonas lignilytica]
MSSQAIPLRDQPYMQALRLGVFTLLVCLLVSSIASMTKEPIKKRQLEDTQNMLSQVFPANLYDNHISKEEYTLTLDGKPVHFFLGRKNGVPSGVVLFADATGYSGAINMLLGIDANGVLTGVRVTNHKETPGLGDLIEPSKSKWIFSFDGKSLDNTSQKNWHVKKDGGEFDSFTGATITPRGVVKGVYEGLTLFARHKAEILGVKQGAKS